MKKKMTRSKLRQKVKKDLFKAHSDKIKKRDHAKYNGLCPLCIPCAGRLAANPSTCAFHWVRRNIQELGWDGINLTFSCWPCNAEFSGRWGKFHASPMQAPFWDWYKKEHGQEQYDELMRRRRISSHNSLEDLQDKLQEMLNDA